MWVKKGKKITFYKPRMRSIAEWLERLTANKYAANAV
jgi:hypothetical protein